MPFVLAALLLASIAAPALFRVLDRRAFYVLALLPAAACGYTVLSGYPVVGGDDKRLSYRWIAGLDVHIAFRMDTLAWVMAIIVTGVGALVLFYCARYFKPDDHGLGRFGAVLLAFAGTMYGLVVADDVFMLFVFWEATTVFSYLLIGHATILQGARRAALQALVVTTAGGLSMFVGLVLLAETAHTTLLSAILADPPSGPATTTAIILILVGALSKSALIPFHFWLPAAMAAPTPVSAYLHAAAMVKAGVYIIGRMAPGFADTPGWQPLLIGLGLATMLIGGWRSLRQSDLKLLLAYGTVSQLGFLTVLFGFGTADAALAALAMLIAHALFKSTLFLVVGVIDRRTGTRDLTKLSGLGRQAPLLTVCGVLGAASMAGVFPLAGFAAKETVYSTFLLGHPFVLTGLVLGSMLTVAYSARFVYGAFLKKRGVADCAYVAEDVDFLLAPAVLTAGSLGAGLFAAAGDGIIADYAGLFGTGPDLHLALWHGFGMALALSAVTVAAGLAVAAAGRSIASAGIPAVFDANRAYRHSMALLDRAAVAVTSRTQRGSLPIYLGIIFGVFAVALGTALAAGRAWAGGVTLFDDMFRHVFDHPAQLTIAVVMITAAVTATRASKRFAAVVVVGVTGYGMTVLFAIHGAPDLALTQALIETITLVVFILVLRRLPGRIGQAHGSVHKRLRAIIAAVVGAVVAVVAAIALHSRQAAPISDRFGELAVNGGHGSNIVNVTLVDIRGWDTFGEISVLVIAATGVASLVFLRGRTSTLSRLDGGPQRQSFVGRHKPLAESSGRRTWLLAGRTLAPENRSIILEVVVRLTFHTAVVLSIYLLFAGHNSPGGGFAGGLVAGLALIARYLAGGHYELAEAAPVPPGILLGSGIGLAALTGLGGLIGGGAFLRSSLWSWNLPVIGHGEFVTSTVFDIGVYLVVVGLMLDVLRTLGAEVDRQQEHDPEHDDAETVDSSDDVVTTGASTPGSRAGSMSVRGPGPSGESIGGSR